MRTSNDTDGSETINLCSLGVVDLDLTVCPDVFGLKAFDKKFDRCKKNARYQDVAGRQPMRPEIAYPGC